MSAPHERKHSGLAWPVLVKLPNLLPRRKSGDAENAPRGASIRLDAMLELPAELVRGIVSYLEFTDVKNLRLVGRGFNELVTGHGSEIPRYWSTYELRHVPRLLSTSPTAVPDWHHVLRQTRRWDTTLALCKRLLHYSQYKIPLRHTTQRNLRFGPVADLVLEGLMPLTFTLSDYLAQIKERVMALSCEDDISVECQAHLDAMTVRLLEQTSLPEVRSLQHAWLFLLGIINFALSRPTYAGTVERTVRGWTADPLDRCSLARILVFGNLSAVKKILELRNYNDRRKWAQAFLKSLDPASNSRWAEKWRGLDIGLSDAPVEQQARKAVKMDIHMHCLWVQGAKLVLDKAGGEHVLTEEELKPSNETTIRFLSELAGHDLVTSHPSSFPFAASQAAMMDNSPWIRSDLDSD